MLASLWLPILLSAVAVFFVSFLSWMALQLHKNDWRKIEREEEFLKAVGDLRLAEGSYSFPYCGSGAEMKSEAFQKKWEAGPRGILTTFGKTSMGQNLVLTFLLFLATSLLLAYLASIAFRPGAPSIDVFRFVATGALMAHLIGIVQHSIWFRCRIVGHLIEAVAFAAVTGAIFAAMWPAA